MQTFGERIKALRLARGESQVQTARAMNVSPQLISQYENGAGYQDNPKLKTIRAFAAHFGVSAFFLIEGKNTP